MAISQPSLPAPARGLGATISNLWRTTHIPEPIEPTTAASREPGRRLVCTVGGRRRCEVRGTRRGRGELVNGPMDRRRDTHTAGCRDLDGYLWEIAQVQCAADGPRLTRRAIHYVGRSWPEREWRPRKCRESALRPSGAVIELRDLGVQGGGEPAPCGVRQERRGRAPVGTGCGSNEVQGADVQQQGADQSGPGTAGGKKEPTPSRARPGAEDLDWIAALRPCSGRAARRAACPAPVSGSKRQVAEGRCARG